MRVTVRLFASLRKGRTKSAVLDLADGAALRAVLQRLEIPEDEVSLRLVNGQFAEFEQVLASEDVVSLFPAIGGG
jgi:molybdopterin converting factor small subunit